MVVHPVQFNGITIEQAENNFKNVNYHDNIKDKYCIDNNITLIRISYEDRENIDYILLDQLIKLGILENI